MCLTLVFCCSVTCQVTELFYILHIIRKDTTKPANIKKHEFFPTAQELAMRVTYNFSCFWLTAIT